MAQTAPSHSSLGARLKGALRPKKSRSRLAKKPPSEDISAEIVRRNNETISKSAAAFLGQDVLRTPPPISRPPPPPPPPPADAPVLDRHTGERQDITALIHGLQDSWAPGEDAIYEEPDENRPPGEPMIASLPPKIWGQITAYLNPAEAASLAFANKQLANILGPWPWEALRLEENRMHRVKFLSHMDASLPRHLLCIPCAVFHVRIQPGEEELKPPHLVTRAARYSPAHGIQVENLFRRWKDHESGWSHQSRYYVINGHLFMRIVSQVFAPPGLPASGQRHLLYSRGDYTPYFSACAHWRDGELMKLCKCALNHIPKPRVGNGPEQRMANRMDKAFHGGVASAAQVVSQCTECKSIRRCPECPTEYLIELKLSEDKSDPFNRFKQSICVTRWSDLGDGSTPESPEWAACNGDIEWDSFKAIGKRAISGTFESQTGDFMPYQGVKSLNPKGIKKGEEGDDWY